MTNSPNYTPETPSLLRQAGVYVGGVILSGLVAAGAVHYFDDGPTEPLIDSPTSDSWYFPLID